LNKLNLLFSYAYLNGTIINLLNNKDINFLLDSGAFSAWKLKKEIKLDDYCKFVESLPFAPWKYFTLDVIGNPKETLNNYNIMKERGFNPIPIFTRGEDIGMIDEYYKTSDIIGIGGLVGTMGNKGFVKGIMKKIGDRKCHWLGFTNPNYINYFKPFSADSSSWASGLMYGVIHLYLGFGKWERLTRNKKPSARACQRISELGFDLNELKIREKWRNKRANETFRSIPMASYIKYIQDIENRIGTKIFLAIADLRDLELFIKLYGEQNESINSIGRIGFHRGTLQIQTQNGTFI